jgi:hypothetical protein
MEKRIEPAKRATDVCEISVARFTGSNSYALRFPSAEALGYFQSVRYADEI